MIKKLTYTTAALATSVAFSSGAVVVYNETFEDFTTTSDQSFGVFGWTAMQKDGTRNTATAANPARITYSAFTDIEGNYRAFVGSTSTQNQWLVADIPTITQPLTQVSFLHRESGVGTGEGYRIGFQIGGAWYVQQNVIAGELGSTAILAIIDIATTNFVLWGDAPANDSTAWTTDPATTGGVALISGNVTGFGMLLVQNATSDQFRFDDIKISAVPEPSAAALVGLAGLALILRRRK